MRPLLSFLVLVATPALALAQTEGSDQAAPAAASSGSDSGATGAAGAGESSQAGSDQALPPGTEMSNGEIVFRSALTDKPLDMDWLPKQEITDAVTHFHQTGQNPYVGDEAAVAEGKKTYVKLCAPCHLPSGAGRIGPSLLDDEWRHPRLDTEVGRFEIIYGGGAGAMQAFGKRIPQDDILKVMAYVDSLREGAAKN